jgi:hypothetical protein
MNKEISYNIVNSLLAGALVLLGSFADGEFTFKGLCFAVVAGSIVAVTKFRDYWSSKEKVYKCKLLSFI